MTTHPVNFPLWLVLNPTPHSDICAEIGSFDRLESVLRDEKVSGRNLAFYTDVAVARADAAARLAKREGKKPRALAEVLALLDRIDVNGKSLPSDLREEIVTTLDAARAAGWRPPAT